MPGRLALLLRVRGQPAEVLDRFGLLGHPRFMRLLLSNRHEGMDGEEEEPDGHHHEDFDDRVRDYDLPPQAHTGRRAEYDTGRRAYYDAGRRASSAREQRSSAAPAPTTFGGRSAACATAMPMATAGADSDLD